MRPVEIDVDAIAALPLACVHREYPNAIAHVVASDDDVKPPRRLTPAFYGCFDWHSAVHAHWSLARIARRWPSAESAPRARAALARSLTSRNVDGELAYLGRADRAHFERPYGLAWLLTLALELAEWDEPDARRWSEALEPLVRLAAGRLIEWLPKLTMPIRTGEHGQTAFALGLALDWARGFVLIDPSEAGRAGAPELGATIEDRALHYFGGDADARLDAEPSGHDFLSPCLAEADLLRRVLPADRFAAWLAVFLPRLPTSASTAWLTPVTVSDRRDWKLVHLDGLNLSRAWMLDGIAAALPDGDPRRGALTRARDEHGEAGLAALPAQAYEGAHWLGTFALYWLTQRGHPARAQQDGTTPSSHPI